MRVLHVVKTSSGCAWAAAQASELVRLGVEVHAAIPDGEGKIAPAWYASGARVHLAGLDFPVSRPWDLPKTRRAARSLVAEVAPDLIHSHTVGTTMLLRSALGKHHGIPLIFQVPGPLHLEHAFFRNWDLRSAGPDDYWIASSRCIQRLYERAGVAEGKLFLSYYGNLLEGYATERTGVLRRRLDLPESALVVGNINYIYPPKRYLGQRVGLKCHEDVIDALAIARKRKPEIAGVLVGGAWGNGENYERKLRDRAAKAGVLMPGFLAPEIVRNAWPDFDLAVHVPLSENCGGVLEPLLAGVPVIGGDVGGIPELVREGETGKLVEIRNPARLADAILEVLADLPRYQVLAENGRRLARDLFDVRRTSREVLGIYGKVLNDRAGQQGCATGAC